MDALLKIWAMIQGNLPDLLSAAAHLCLFASVIVKLTPTLKDDAYLKTIIRFIGRYVALDKYGPQPSA